MESNICDRCTRNCCFDCPYAEAEDCDGCPNDSGKVESGICGCGVPDEGDEDGDSILDCVDQCPGADDALFAPECQEAIPTVSGWGLIVLTLTILTGGKLVFGRRTGSSSS